jgi:Ser-tRNA(Ala) deacylase AlaX
MNDTQYLNTALAQMHTGQWFGFSSDEQNYSTLIVHNSSITKPTEADVNAKIQEIKDAETAVANNKISATNKLKALGLTDAEIGALKI